MKEENMGAFYVRGVTIESVREQLDKGFVPDRGQTESQDMEQFEREAQELYKTAKLRKVSPDFDSPQIAAVWIENAKKYQSRDLSLMAKYPVKDASGAHLRTEKGSLCYKLARMGRRKWMKTIEPPVIAQATERQFRDAIDDAAWLEQLQRWAESGYPIIWGGRIRKQASERMQIRLNTLLRIAEEELEAMSCTTSS